MQVREEMEKSIQRKDLALERHERARAHRFKYNLPERERGKKKQRLSFLCGQCRTPVPDFHEKGRFWRHPSLPQTSSTE